MLFILPGLWAWDKTLGQDYSASFKNQDPDNHLLYGLTVLLPFVGSRGHFFST